MIIWRESWMPSFKLLVQQVWFLINKILLVILQIYPVCLVSSKRISLTLVTSSCACPNYSVTYECTVVGQGATVWQGSALDCESSSSDIVLLHSRFTLASGTNVTCNNGGIVGQSLRVENKSYTSQLKVKVSSDLIGKTVECNYDNGTVATNIGSAIIAG